MFYKNDVVDRDRIIMQIPPNLVVRRLRRIPVAARGEDLQVQHPVGSRHATALHFHPALPRILGPLLIRNQIVQTLLLDSRVF
jgi:hypothetical protein